MSTERLSALFVRLGFRSLGQDWHWLLASLALALLANASGLFVTLRDEDPSLYAAIAKTMVERQDFVNLFVSDQDWLDKPHLPFWLTAASFMMFGFSTWAYKLPALVFALIAVCYTYAFARLFYNKRVAAVASIILLTAEHFLLSNTDVRAEPYLTAFVIGAVYHFFRASHRGCQRRSKNASAGRSNNTSMMLARRPPELGTFFVRHQAWVG